MLRSLAPRAILPVVVLIGLSLSACFDTEPKEREAFKTFLQTRIIDKPGVRVPILTAEEGKALGRYKEHYEVIARFHSQMNDQVSKPFQDAMKIGAINNVSDMMKNKANLLNIRETTRQLRATLDTAQAAAEAEKNKLVQPDDLKSIYAQAFERDVTRPAETVRAIFPSIDGIFDASLKVVAFLEDNQGKWALSGSTIEFNDPQLVPEFNKLATELASKSREAVESQRKMHALISG